MRWSSTKRNEEMAEILSREIRHVDHRRALSAHPAFRVDPKLPAELAQLLERLGEAERQAPSD